MLKQSMQLRDVSLDERVQLEAKYLEPPEALEVHISHLIVLEELKGHIEGVLFTH